MTLSCPTVMIITNIQSKIFDIDIIRKAVGILAVSL